MTNPQEVLDHLAAVEEFRATAEQAREVERELYAWPTSVSANPKDAAAQRERKARLDLLEPVAEREIAAALEFGAITKGYGVRNYTTSPINARVYVAAMKRHIDAWLDGEDHAPDSGIHHLGHIGANVHVVLAAIAAGSFVDDRSIADDANVDPG